MKNEPLLLDYNIESVGICLRSFWDIYADSSYKSDWPQDRKLPLVKNSIVAIYSKQGQGTIRLKNMKEIHITGNSITWIDSVTIDSYWCRDLLWELYWIEFIIHGNLVIPLKQPIQIQNQHPYLTQLNDLTQTLKSLDFYKGEMHSLMVEYVSSIFSKLLYQWLMLPYKEEMPESMKKIEWVINEMHSRISENWSIVDMAKMVGYSEQHFRTLFIKYTKSNPKSYYQNIKLNLAYALLKKGSLSIEQISEELAFSDQFHFSKAFKRLFNIAPSTLRSD